MRMKKWPVIFSTVSLLVLLAAAVLFTPAGRAHGAEPQNEAKPDQRVLLEVPNSGFEEWKPLEQVPSGWQLKERLFPVAWSVEARPGATGEIEQISNPADQPVLCGKYSAFLRQGRMVSAPVAAPIGIGTGVEISLLARGQGGSFTVHARSYWDGSRSDENIVDFATLMTERTGEEWKRYAMQVHDLRGAALRLDIEGDQVVLGDIKIYLVNKSEKTLPKMRLAIPVAATKPVIDGVFSREEWSAAVGSKTGFMDITTACAVSRQSEYYVTANDEKLFVACRIPVRAGGLKNTVTKRDGDVYTDESLEVYVNPTPGRESIPVVYQFVVNTAGVLFDKIEQLAIAQNDVGWNCKGLEIATGHQTDPAAPDGYAIIELAIPLSEVGLKPETPFGLNLCRNLYGPAENADLSGRGYKDYQSMVTCVISKQAPAVVWEYQGDVKEGRLKLVADIANPTGERKSFETMLRLGERSEKSRCDLEPAASRKLVLDASAAPIRSGNLTVQITDIQSQPLLAQDVRFDVEQVNRTPSAGKTAPPSQVEFYPIQKKINIRLRNLADRKEAACGQGYGPTEITVHRGNKLILRKTVAKPQLVENTGHVTIPFDPPGEGTFQVKVVLHDQQDAVLETVSDTIEVQPLPWLNNNLGKDRIVIPPYTPLEIRNSTVSCWGRTYEFNGSGLPVTLTSQGQNMLTEPMRFVLQSGEGMQEGRPGRKLKFDERAPDRVAFRGETRFPKLTIRLKGLMEYDGMVRYEMEIIPKGEAAVERLSLQIPMRDGCYFHWIGYMRFDNGWLMNRPAEGEYRDPRVPVWSPKHSYDDAKSKGIPHALYLPREDGLVWSSRGLVSQNLHGNFLPAFTLGNTRYGLGWFADNDRGWIHDPADSCFELVRRGETTLLNVNFIAHPATLKARRTIVFGILATPVRPGVVAGDLALKLNCRFGGEYNFLKQHQGVVYGEPYLAKRLRDGNQAGGYATAIYIGNEFPTNDPATKACWHEWAREPFGLYTYGRDSLLPRKLYGTDPDNYVSLEDCTCSSRIDYQIACLKDAMEQGLIDGVYLDNSYPNPCVSIQHERCGYVREDGRVQGGAHISETRELLKRTAVLSYTHHCLAPRVTVHLTSALMMPLVSFADIYFDGEWSCEKYDFMDFFTQPYLEGFCAGAWGGNPGWLPMGAATRSSLGALKLYDLWILGGCDPKTARIEREFGVLENDCRFVGYWRKDAGAIGGLPAEVKASYYLRPGKRALVYVTNFSKEKREVALPVSQGDWNLARPRAFDAEANQELPVANGKCALTINGHDFRVIRVEAAPNP